MTTIETKVDIPKNRKLLLDLTLPADLPPGEAEIRVTIIPSVSKKPEQKAFVGLAGSLKDSKTFSRDGVELQREIRDEW